MGKFLGLGRPDKFQAQFNQIVQDAMVNAGASQQAAAAAAPFNPQATAQMNNLVTGLVVGVAGGTALANSNLGSMNGPVKGIVTAGLSAAGTAASNQLVASGLNSLGLSGGVSFGKNQNLAWLPFALIIGAVLVLVIRPFGLFSGRRKR